jgi:hypothetical protein
MTLSLNRTRELAKNESCPAGNREIILVARQLPDQKGLQESSHVAS